VLGMVYEGRPNVTVDAFGLALKSGNAALLRGSSSAAKSNEALVAILREALSTEDLPADAVQLISAADRSSVTHLIQARGLVDVVIPRGGAGLIDAVVRDSQVPTIETGVGNCHVYVNDASDLDMAERILLNSKTRRPSVCNAAETLLVDAAIADQALPRLINALQDAGVTVHLDPDEDHLRREYLSMDIAVAVVNDVVLQTHVNNRITADLRTYRALTGHERYRNISVEQDLVHHTTRDVLCGNIAPGPPGALPQICLIMTGPVVHGRRASHGGFYLPSYTPDKRVSRYGCFGSAVGEDLCGSSTPPGALHAPVPGADG